MKMRRVKKGRKKIQEIWGSVPDVPGEMFAPAEDHATFAVASALKGLCRGGAIAFGGSWGLDGALVGWLERLRKGCDCGSHRWRWRGVCIVRW